MADYQFNDIHFDQDLLVIFKALKDYCHRPENPFRVDSDHIDTRGFTIDLTRTNSFVSGEMRCKVHVSGYPDAEPGEADGDAGCSINIFVTKANDTEEKVIEQVRDRLVRGINRQLEGKTPEQMLAESTTTVNVKDLIGNGAEKRNFIIGILIVAIGIAIMLPSGLAQGCML